MRRRLVAAVGLCAAVLAACTSHTKFIVTPTDVTQTQTVVHTTTPPITVKVTPDSSVAPLPPGTNPAAGEVDGTCPYIAAGLNVDDGSVVPNLAEAEGDHVYRVTLLTKLHPVGCRFYFYAPPYEAIADIQPYVYETRDDARNALVLASRTGSDPQPRPSPALAPGVDAILYRTAFFGEDGRQDWACAFAKGTILVVVHTQQNKDSLNAFNIAKDIVAKF